MAKEYTREQLEKLTQNPHYTMGAQELQALQMFRNQDFQKKKASTKFEKASSSFKKHETELESEDDE